MKGIVFNLFEQSFTDAHGADAWDDLLEAAGLEGAYTSLGNYPDQQLAKLIGAASVVLGRSESETERWLGRVSMGPLSSLYPEFFEPHADTVSFVLTLNSIIHPEVRKLYPGADVPDFGFDQSSTHRLSLRYRSRRKMCAFAEGLILGAASYYGERVSIEQPSCMKQGDEACLIVCAFADTESHE